jgi:hypothetical protein
MRKHRGTSSAWRAVDPDWENEPVFHLPLEAKLRMMPPGTVMPPRPGLTAQPPVMPEDVSGAPPPPSPADPPDVLDGLARDFMKSNPALSYEEARRMADFV